MLSYLNSIARSEGLLLSYSNKSSSGRRALSILFVHSRSKRKMLIVEKLPQKEHKYSTKMNKWTLNSTLGSVACCNMRAAASYGHIYRKSPQKFASCSKIICHILIGAVSILFD